VEVPGARDLDTLAALQPVSRVSPAVRASLNFSDKLLYIFTSGTTGLPKAAVIKHARYILAAGGLTIMIGVRPGETVYCPLPLYHTAAGMIVLSGCMAQGISMVIREKFSASQYWADCVRYNVSCGQYIGEMARYLLAAPPSSLDTTHSVRLMFGNGLRPDIWQEFTSRFRIPNIAEFYGSTEGNSNIINYDNTVGAVGFVPVLFSSLLPLGLIRVDEAGQPLRDPATGLCIRCRVGEPGEFVGVIQAGHPVREFTGYSDKESTARKVVRDVWRRGDACFRSGDILTMDWLGYLYFRDRKGDTFRWKGENVSTAEVEAVLTRLTGRDAVVYGVQVPGCDGRAGMAAVAALPGQLQLADLAAGLAARLPSYAQPRIVRLVPELDMTGTFKLKKRELQESGWSPGEVSDPLYLLHKGEFLPLTPELHTKVYTKQIRL